MSSKITEDKTFEKIDYSEASIKNQKFENCEFSYCNFNSCQRDFIAVKEKAWFYVADIH